MTKLWYTQDTAIHSQSETQPALSAESHSQATQENQKCSWNKNRISLVCIVITVGMSIEIIPSELGMTPARLDTSGETHRCPYLEDLLHVLLATHGRPLHGHLLGHLSRLVGSWGKSKGGGGWSSTGGGKGNMCKRYLFHSCRRASSISIHLSIHQPIYVHIAVNIYLTIYV